MLKNIEKLHTTELGVARIKKNLSLNDEDVVEWCKKKISEQSAAISRKGKNYYVFLDGDVIVVNACSYTIITEHKK